MEVHRTMKIAVVVVLLYTVHCTDTKKRRRDHEPAGQQLNGAKNAEISLKRFRTENRMPSVFENSSSFNEAKLSIAGPHRSF